MRRGGSRKGQPGWVRRPRRETGKAFRECEGKVELLDAEGALVIVGVLRETDGARAGGMRCAGL